MAPSRMTRKRVGGVAMSWTKPKGLHLASHLAPRSVVPQQPSASPCRGTRSASWSRPSPAPTSFHAGPSAPPRFSNFFSLKSSGSGFLHQASSRTPHLLTLDATAARRLLSFAPLAALWLPRAGLEYCLEAAICPSLRRGARLALPRPFFLIHENEFPCFLFGSCTARDYLHVSLDHQHWEHGRRRGGHAVEGKGFTSTR